MSGTWDSFERFKQRGLDARRAGEWDSARVYLLEAARAMVQLSKQADGELQTAREQTAQRLLELARDCQTSADSGRKAPDARRAANAPATAEPGASSGVDWIVKEKPTIRFDDVAGLEEVKQDIRLKMLYPFEHADLAKRFGIKAGGGVLLYGPPGTGKTMLARATAGEIDAAFFRISPADILSKWVGEAEQNIKKLFDAARAETRSIIFIDEIEALVPARRDDGSSVMQRVVPQFLQEMEGFDKTDRSTPLFFLGATNVPWQLDPAVLRPGRFDEKIYIPLPDLAARRRMLDIYLGKRPLADDLQLDSVAQALEGYSGADIRYVCDRAALLPFMKSLAGGHEVQIDSAVLNQVIGETTPSVSPALLQRFEQWASATKREG